MTKNIKPIGTPILAHSFPDIFNLFAQTIFGIFSGISIPPEINKLIKIGRL
ncbi:hypothetical protein MTLP_11260 [Candidatus Methanoliparum sp. LAM-1]|nr:hypothetical protein [Candidatus Methanoliparum sp. LAM-1]BDC36444.1 hypothetical protein MTLP_11260 [Candidatus Methanoliparum sp. LAM-1]